MNIMNILITFIIITLSLCPNVSWAVTKPYNYIEKYPAGEEKLASRTRAGEAVDEFNLSIVSEIISSSPCNFMDKVEQHFKGLNIPFRWIFSEKINGTTFLVFRIGEKMYLKKIADDTLEDISSDNWPGLLFTLLDLIDKDYQEEKSLNYDLRFNPNYDLSKDGFTGLSMADWDERMKGNVYWSTYNDSDKRELIRRVENLKDMPKVVSRLVTKYIHDKYGPDQDVKIIGMWVNGSTIYKRSTKDKTFDLDCVVIIEGKGMRDIIFRQPEPAEVCGINIEGMVFDSSDNIKIGETHQHTLAAVYSAVFSSVCLIGTNVIEGNISRRSHLMSVKGLCKNGLRHLVKGPRYYRKRNNRFIVIKSILHHLGIIKEFDHLACWRRNDELEDAINSGDDAGLRNFLEQFLREHEEILEAADRESEEIKRQEKTGLIRAVLLLSEIQREQFLKEEIEKRRELINKYKDVHGERENLGVWSSYLKKASDVDCDEDTHLRILETGDENLILTVAQNTKHQNVIRRIYKRLSTGYVLYRSILYQLARNIHTPQDVLDDISQISLPNNIHIINEIASNLNTPDDTLDRLRSLYGGKIGEKASDTKRRRHILKRLGISIPADCQKYKGKKDLHVHSVFSDGYFTPEELITGASFLGLDTVAVTDHMSLSGAAEAKRCGARHNVNVTSGIEFNAHSYINERKVHLHLLGYDVDINNEELIERLEEYRNRNNGRAKTIVERMNGLLPEKYRISFNELLEVSPSRHIAGKDILNILRKKGAGTDIVETARRCLLSAQKEGGEDYVEKTEFDTFEGVLQLIKRAGGRAVLAHPRVFVSAIKRTIAKDFNGSKDELNEEAWQRFAGLLKKSFVPAGLTGIEVYYMGHNYETVQRLKGLAEELGLEISYGSDFHGETYLYRRLGETDTVIKREIEELAERFSKNEDLHEAYLAWNMLLKYASSAEECLIDLLKTGDNFTKIFSVIGLGRIGSKKAIPYLIRILQIKGESGGFDIPEALRQYAALALGEKGGEEAVDALIEGLAERRMDKTGKNIGGSPAAYNCRKALIKIGNSEEFKDRVAIKSILGIRKTLSDRLSTRQGREDIDILRARHLVLILGCLENNRIDRIKILKEILERYNDKNFANQDRIIWANTIAVLGDLVSEESVNLLIASYKNPRAPPLVKVRVIEALGDIGGNRARGFLGCIKPDKDSRTKKERIVLKKALQRTLDMLNVERSDGRGLNIFHASFHGLYDEMLKGLGGRDGGGQITHLVELVDALGSIAGKDINRISALSRAVVYDEVLDIAIPEVDYSEMVQPMGQKAEIVRIPFGPEKFISRSELWQYADVFSRNYNRYIRKRGVLPDVIHIHSADGATVEVAKDAKEKGIPVVFTIQAGGLVKLKALTEDLGRRPREVFETIRQPAELISRILGEEELLKLADRVVVGTQGEIDGQWSLYAGMSEIDKDSKFRVIAPGVKSDMFCPGKELALRENKKLEGVRAKLISEIQKQISEENMGKPVILVLSRLAVRKNIHGLVKIWANNPYLRENSNLIICGGGVRVLDGGTAEDLVSEEKEVWDKIQNELKGKGLEGKTAFLGGLHHEDEVPEIYRIAADGVEGLVGGNGIFVNPALYEPFGLTILESMATGLVTVATNNGGPKEVIKDGVNGFLVDVRNEEGFGECLVRVLKDSNLRERVSAESRKYVVENYSWKRQAVKFMDLYREFFRNEEWDEYKQSLEFLRSV